MRKTGKSPLVPSLECTALRKSKNPALVVRNPESSDLKKKNGEMRIVSPPKGRGGRLEAHP